MLDIDRKDNAIQVLNECLSGKKNKNQWQPILEEVIVLLLETCIKSQNHKAVKDGLHQYRTICFPSNSNSLEKVIYTFLQNADKLVKDAKETGSSSTLTGTDESTESKILRSISGDNFEDRNERNHLQPYIKFLWESFRAILDLVRNKPKLELTYYNTAVHAMRFCVQYERKQEFKRIGEMLRMHFQQLITHGETNNTMISITTIQNSANSLNCLYGARFEYLNCSVRLELWQEAFRTVEDINEIMMAIKRQPAPQRMANYYEKLAQLFWTSHSYVFHAYAWLRFYLISRDQNKSLSGDDLQKLASVVLISALSVPVELSTSEQSKNHQDFFELHLEKEKNSRLSALLGRSSTLSREQLLKEIEHHDIPSNSVPELRDLFYLLENKYHPLDLCKSLSNHFQFVNENNALSRYSTLLKKAAFTRQLQQLSRVFKTMKMDTIYHLAPVSDPHQVEKLIVRCSKSNIISVRLNHQAKMLTFVNNSLESTNIKSNLFTVYEKLNHASNLIQPNVQEERKQKKLDFINNQVSKLSEKENRLNQQRSDYIEDEKEKKETIDKLKNRLQELKQQLAQLDSSSSSSTSAASGASNNQQQRQLQSSSSSATNEPADEVSKEEKKRLKAIKQAKEKREKLSMKFASLVARVNYLERARREEEQALLENQFKESAVKHRELHELKSVKYLEQKKQEHQKDLEEKHRLSKMNSEATKLQDDLLSVKREEYAKKLAEVQAHNNAILQKIQLEKEKLREQKVKEEIERRKKKEEEEKRRQEEELRRKKELEDENRRREEERQQREGNLHFLFFLSFFLFKHFSYFFIY